MATIQTKSAAESRAFGKCGACSDGPIASARSATAEAHQSAAFRGGAPSRHAFQLPIGQRFSALARVRRPQMSAMTVSLGGSADKVTEFRIPALLIYLCHASAEAEHGTYANHRQ